LINVEGLQNFFQSLQGGWVYGFLFLCSMGENLFPPLPGDTFVVLGAFLVGRRQTMFLPAYLATTLGSVLGFMILYCVGLLWGRNFFKKKPRRFFTQEHFERVEQWFSRYGYAVIGVNRFLAGFRGVVALGAGIVGMDAKKVVLLSLLSCFVWNGILMGVGLWVGENWEVIVRHYQRVVFLVIVFFLVFFLVRAYLRKRGRR